MEPGRKIISFSVARLIGSSKVWYFVGSRAAFPVFYEMTEMWYSNHVRDLWFSRFAPGTEMRLEPILLFLEENWGTPYHT
jgi:hypothetical protein